MTPIEEVKSKLDIVDVINSYVPLKQTGLNWRANCPFHSEKTPSFMVSKDKQIWHCFGCSEGGDVISFVQKHEGLEFPEALKMLADKAGVSLPSYSSTDNSSQKNILWQINDEAVKFFQRNLSSDKVEATKTKEYLKKRGLTDETIATWQLGLSLSGWQDLYDFLKTKNFSDHDILASGLITKKEDKVFDRFRQRLIFPIKDVQGKVAGFTARTLVGIVFEGEDFGGKYVNTPQTPVYNKSVILYGLDLAKQAIKRADYTIVVEGNLDVIMSHQSGVENVVAVSGTALTPDQLRMLGRFTSNLILAFDSDVAGSQAVYKSGVISAGQFDMNVKVIVLDGAKDPADIILEDPDKWKEAIKTSIPILDFYFEEILKRVDLDRADHKKIAVKKLLGIISQIADSVEKDHYLKKLSTRLNISEEILREGVDWVQKPAPEEKIVEVKQDKQDQVSYWLLALVASYPKVLPALIDRIEPEMIDSNLQDLYKKLIIYYTKNHSTALDGLTNILEGQETTTWSELVHRATQLYPDWESEQFEREFDQLTKRLKKRWLETRLRSLTKAIAQAESDGSKNDVDRLTSEFNDVSKKLAEYLS